MRKNREKEVARQGIVLLMDAIESKIKDYLDGKATSTKGIAGLMDSSVEVNGYVNALDNLANVLDRLSR